MMTLIALTFLFVTPPRHSTPREQFQREHPCPATGKKTGRCFGYVIDHVEPLDCGGSDSPDNMQWQTVTDAKAKDKWERIGCKNGKRVFDWHIFLWSGI